MKVNKAIGFIGRTIKSAFKKKDKATLEPGIEKKTIEVEAGKKETKKYSPSIFGKKNKAEFVSRSIGSATKDKRKRHVNKAKFQKKAKLKRRKAA